MIFSSLPMYDFPHVALAWDVFYHEIARNSRDLGLDPPPELTRGEQAMDWGGDVFFSMTCGAPFRNQFSEHLHLLGTLDFGLVEGRQGYYYSKLIGAPKPARTRMAVNDMASQSGFHAVYDLVYSNADHVEILISGSHERSMQMVADGLADIAGIDAQSYRYICAQSPAMSKLPIWHETIQSPGLPFVTTMASDIQRMTQAIEGACMNLRPEHRQILGIRGLAQISKSEYLAVKNAQNSV